MMILDTPTLWHYLSFVPFTSSLTFSGQERIKTSKHQRRRRKVEEGRRMTILSLSLKLNHQINGQKKDQTSCGVCWRQPQRNIVRGIGSRLIRTALDSSHNKQTKGPLPTPFIYFNYWRAKKEEAKIEVFLLWTHLAFVLTHGFSL